MMRTKHPAQKLLSIIGCLVLGLASEACSPKIPQSPIAIGGSAADVFRAFPEHGAFADVCDGVTRFPGDPVFTECLSRDEYMIIFRKGDFQYTYEILDEIVQDVSVSNHSITWP